MQILGASNGEGFSIVSLQCALVEFLQTLRDGTNFKFGGGEYEAGEKYYGFGHSKRIFTRFLVGQSDHFDCYFDKETSEDFYTHVRCSLLHSAMTTGGWKIQKGCIKQPNCPVVFEFGGLKVLYRDVFHESLKRYVETYKIDLKGDVNLQSNFIQKFDGICELSN